MPKVHIYARSQARLSTDDAEAVQDLLARVKTIVEAAGNGWDGSVVTQPDADGPPVPAAEDEESADEDESPSDDTELAVMPDAEQPEPRRHKGRRARRP